MRCVQAGGAGGRERVDARTAEGGGLHWRGRVHALAACPSVCRVSVADGPAKARRGRQPACSCGEGVTSLAAPRWYRPHWGRAGRRTLTASQCAGGRRRLHRQRQRHRAGQPALALPPARAGTARLARRECGRARSLRCASQVVNHTAALSEHDKEVVEKRSRATLQEQASAASSNRQRHQRGIARHRSVAAFVHRPR